MSTGNGGSGWQSAGHEIASRWSEFEPPARPSAAELSVFARHVEAERARRGVRHALVLGSTPELRDLLADCGFTHDCFDVSAGNHRLLGALCRREHAGGIIVGDWLRQVGGPFSLMVGDCSLNMLPLPDWPIALRHWHHSLTPGGVLVHRFYSWRDADVPSSSSRPDAALERVLAAGGALGLSFFQSASYELYRRVVNADTWTVDFRDLVAELERLRVSRAISDADVASVDHLRTSAACGFSMTIPPRALIEALVSAAGFRVERVETGGDTLPFHADCPIYVLSKRTSEPVTPARARSLR